MPRIANILTKQFEIGRPLRFPTAYQLMIALQLQDTRLLHPNRGKTRIWIQIRPILNGESAGPPKLPRPAHGPLDVIMTPAFSRAQFPPRPLAGSIAAFQPEPLSRPPLARQTARIREGRGSRPPVPRRSSSLPALRDAAQGKTAQRRMATMRKRTSRGPTGGSATQASATCDRRRGSGPTTPAARRRPLPIGATLPVGRRVCHQLSSGRRRAALP